MSILQEKTDPVQVGFEVIGGKAEPHFPNDPSIFVSHVTKGGAADGKLKVNDTLLRINSLETVNVDKRTAMQALWESSGVVNLVSNILHQLFF